VIKTSTSGNVRDVNNTCNVIHIARSSQFGTNGVLNQIAAAQGMLVSGAELPPDIANSVGSQSGVSWLGGDLSDVMSCSWIKDLEGVVGVLNLQLKERSSDVDYFDAIQPGDMLVVFMDDSGNYDPSKRVTGTLISIVVVDRVGLSVSVNNNATVRSVSVSARDLAVVLSESSTAFDQAFAQIENGMYTGGWLNLLFGDKAQFSLSPMENILNLLLLLYDSSATKNDAFPKGSVFSQLQWKLSPQGNEVAGPNPSLDPLATLSQVISLIDVTTFIQNPMPFYALAKPPAIVQAGNIWSLLQSYANTTINEFFIDVRDNNQQEIEFRKTQANFASDNYFDPAQEDLANQSAAIARMLNSPTFRTSQKNVSTVALVHRQRPYDQPTFDALPYTVVDTTEVESLEIARSSHDVFNWFRMKFPDLPVSMQEFVAGISIAPQSIAKFGYRRMDAETIYMFTTSQGAVAFSKGSTKTDFADVFLAYMDILTSWYTQNEYFFAGQLTMRFKPSIRIGTRLKFQQQGQIIYEFYVQGVQHSYSKEVGASRTMLTITRGREADPPSVPIIFQQQGTAFSAAQVPRNSPPAAAPTQPDNGPTFDNVNQGSVFNK
jgi:hypothetical protein